MTEIEHIEAMKDLDRLLDLWERRDPEMFEDWPSDEQCEYYKRGGR